MEFLSLTSIEYVIYPQIAVENGDRIVGIVINVAGSKILYDWSLMIDWIGVKIAESQPLTINLNMIDCFIPFDNSPVSSIA